MKISSFGKESGNPHYVYVGNAIMIDPTFFDSKTKNYFKGKQMNLSDKVYQKEFILQELVNLQKSKYPDIEVKKQGKLSFINRNRPGS